eukprot:m.351702 g.351702  ORF g.351702 m.351702 type:complete len:333 (-) comp16321_c0_seq1:96-1094(-)
MSNVQQRCCQNTRKRGGRLLLDSTTSGTKTEGSLEGIVDPPLKTSEGTNHEDTWANTLDGKVTVTKLGGDGTNALALVLGLTKEGDESISWVGDNGANNTSNVTGHEGNLELGALAVGLTWLSVDAGVELFNNLLEEEELGHGVWDLTGPEWDEGTKWKASFSFVCGHGRQCWAESSWEGTCWGSLDLDLDHLHWAEGNISKELGRCRCTEPKGTTVLNGGLLTDHVGVHILEDLVEAELAESLHGVTNQGWEPALEEGTSTLLSCDGAHTTKEAGVFGRVDLHVALGDIKWGDGSVGEATAEDTTNHTLHVVLVGVLNGMGLAAVPLGLSS